MFSCLCALLFAISGTQAVMISPIDGVLGMEFSSDGGCPEWNAFIWPLETLWSMEVERRLFKPGLDPSKIENFTWLAASAVCTGAYDPRAGGPGGSEAQLMYAEVESSETAEFPAVPTGVLPSAYNTKQDDIAGPLMGLVLFKFQGTLRKLMAGKPDMTNPCTMWFVHNVCTVAWWAKESKGSKDGNAKCWASVDYPKGSRSEPDFFKYSKYPEYSACLEHGASKTIRNGVCAASVPAERESELASCTANLRQKVPSAFSSQVVNSPMNR
jgi:hypothetical protein